jgi:hypothetical protein
MLELLKTAVTAKEFWTTLFGAVVGGLISFSIMMKTLREARQNRREDRRRTDQALGNAVHFKLVRIHSNFNGLRRHLDECFAHNRIDPNAQPWQFTKPLVNLPDAMHFTAEEMGMLLGLKNDAVFNAVVELDLVHNTLFDAVRAMFEERRTLLELLKPRHVDPTMLVSGVLDPETEVVVRARMLQVNDLIKNVYVMAQREDESSRTALRQLNDLLRKELGLTYRLQFLDETTDSSQTKISVK